MARLKRLVLPALLALAGYWALFGGQYSLFEVREARRARESEGVELARTLAHTDSLEQRVDSLESDAMTLERLARERFGMVRSGEVLYRLVDPSDSVTAAGDTLR